MKYVLDTHAWLWAVLNHPGLSRRARSAVAAASHERIGLSAISLKEAAWHLARGRIEVDPTLGGWSLWLRDAAAMSEIEILPLTVDIAIESEHLGSEFPPDPADRLIGATARVHGLTLITADKAIRKSRAVRTLW